MTDLFNKLNCGADGEFVNKVESFIQQEADEELYHIDIYKLSQSYNIELSELLNIFIYGVKNGVFTMQWEYHCPYCGGVANETLTLHSAKNEDHCDLCRVDFKNKLDDNIEVFFSI